MNDFADMPVAEFTAVVASTHPIQKYDGRHRLTKDMLFEMAEKYIEDEYKFNFGHDPRIAAEIKVTAANVEPTSDGEHKLVIAFETNQETKTLIEKMTKEARALGQPALGMSYSTTYAFAHTGTDEPTVLFAADAAAYSMTEIAAAAELLPSGVSATVAEYVEFSLADDVVNVIAVVQRNPDVHVVELGLIGTALTEAFRALWREGKRIRYRIQIRRRDGSRTDLLTEVESEAEVQSFTSRLQELESRVNELESEVWEYKNRTWLQRLRVR